MGTLNSNIPAKYNHLMTFKKKIMGLDNGYYQRQKKKKLEEKRVT
jgi:hypothetical protein